MFKDFKLKRFHQLILPDFISLLAKFLYVTDIRFNYSSSIAPCLKLSQMNLAKIKTSQKFFYSPAPIYCFHLSSVFKWALFYCMLCWLKQSRDCNNIFVRYLTFFSISLLFKKPHLFLLKHYFRFSNKLNKGNVQVLHWTQLLSTNTMYIVEQFCGLFPANEYVTSYKSYNKTVTFSSSVKHGSLSSSGGISLTTPTQPYSYKSLSSDVLHSPSGWIWPKGNN